MLNILVDDFYDSLINKKLNKIAVIINIFFFFFFFINVTFTQHNSKKKKNYIYI